ncbi:MAG TPA: type II toxin-antitoxin system death-on-curing family toxin [Chthonomonadaceae bacterium]|nr:type II toxin-antitoxin system death-on-curing family toxin [Chthonomonadaceae bacterium]
MAGPIWIREDVVRAIHQRQLAEHGGLPGVRDPNALASALARPRNLLAYGEPMPDIVTLAAAYAYGIARNHPFADGNKRVSLVVCRTFLMLNGYDIDATQEEKYKTFLRLAAGELSEEELIQWIRQCLVQLAVDD